MDRVFSTLIDRVRGPLRHREDPLRTVVEVSLTILRIRFRRLTLKIYTKGERVHRGMAHNARDLGCRLGGVVLPRGG